jgi:predicted ArsR family transcriptional regulator
MAQQYNKNPSAVEALSPDQYYVTQKIGINSAALRFIHLDDLEAEGYEQYKTLFETKKDA